MTDIVHTAILFKGNLLIDGQRVEPQGIDAFLTGYDQNEPYVSVTLSESQTDEEHIIGLTPRAADDMDVIEKILAAPAMLENMPIESARIFADHIVPLMTNIELDSVRALKKRIRDYDDPKPETGKRTPPTRQAAPTRRDHLRYGDGMAAMLLSARS